MSNTYKRPNRKKKRRVPKATVALYIAMVVIILGICAVVFIVGFNVLNSESENSRGSSSQIVSSSSSNGGFILPNDEQSGFSSVIQSSSESSSDSSVPESSSSDESSSSSKQEQSSSGQSSSSDPNSEVNVNEKFDKEFFKDDLFIGDSIFTGLYLYDFLDQANVAAKVGYTPYGALNSAFDAKGMTAVSYAKQRSPKRIFILLGSNAISSSAETTALKNSYSNLLTTLHSEIPNAKICCISITPVARKTDYPNVDNSVVRSMNEYIEQQSKTLGFDYFDLYSQISDDEGYFLTNYAEVDGMHFKPSTYRLLLSELQKKYS